MANAAVPSQLVVVGSSAGGIEALSTLVTTLPTPFPAPAVARRSFGSSWSRSSSRARARMVPPGHSRSRRRVAPL